ncbi:MAG: alpha/beta hydrolase [Planctomycetes bacterium]|nr:alpha/beta hydrolase [Planctomycetota bacterium]
MPLRNRWSSRNSMENRSKLYFFSVLLCVTSGSLAFGEKPASSSAPTIVKLWPKDQMPGRGLKGPEKELPSRGDNVIRITDINEPSIAVYKVANTSKPTPAVIVCPGGAYNILAYDKEGTEIATWLNSIGITGIVLKYRVPGNLEGAFQDIQRAVRIVRHNAADWNISPMQIGVMGFSAGGHLSARLSTNFSQATYPRLDSVDEKNLRPDFAILVYPAYLSKVPGKLSEGLPVNDKTPPTFIVHTEDDKSFIAGSKVYRDALEAAKVPNDFFLCATGGHGYGLRSDKEISAWPKKCQAWLEKQGYLKGPAATDGK